MDHNKKVVELPLEDVLPNRFQPRIKFNEESIIELSESIKEHGVIQPIVVRPVGDKYEIIAGERRYKASTMAGLTTIPALITNFNDKESAEVALIENVQRKDLTPIEEAISYKKILDMGYLTQEKLADKLGKKQSTVANKLRLLNLDEEVQEALLEDKISERHARSLLKLENPDDQRTILNRIIDERLTVRKTDEEINNMLNGTYKGVVNSNVIENEHHQEPVKTEEPFDFSKLEFLNQSEEKPEVVIEQKEELSIPKFEDLFINNIDSEEVEEKSIIQSEGENPFYKIFKDKLEDSDEDVVAEVEVETAENTNNDDNNQSSDLFEAPTPFVFEDLFVNDSVNVAENLFEEETDAIEYIDDFEEKVNNIEINNIVENEQPEESSNSEEPFDFSKLDFLNTNNVEQDNSKEDEVKTDITGTNTYVTSDIKTVINTIHNCAETIKKYGFQVEIDEIELKDEYRVAFTIKK